MNVFSFLPAAKVIFWKDKGRIGEIRWLYLRDLLHELVVREIKLRYKRSVLGLGWSLLNPMVQLVVFSLVFRYLLPLNIPNYSIFLFTGLLAWNWFQTGLLAAAGAIVNNEELIKRPGFPVAVLPIVTVATHLIHYLLALPVLFVFLWLSDLAPAPTMLLLPVVIVIQFVFMLGLAYLVAAIHVTFRDTEHLLNIFLFLLFYLTPIFYDAAMLPEQVRLFYSLNPLVTLIETYRDILLYHTLPAPIPLLLLFGFSMLLLYGSYRHFVKSSYHFVEEV